MKVVHCRRCRGERLPHVAGIRCVLPSAPHDIRCMEAAASPESSVRPLVMSLRKVVLPLSCYYVRCRFFYRKRSDTEVFSVPPASQKSVLGVTSRD